MKKTLGRIALSAIILSFAACGGNEQQFAETATCCCPEVQCTDETEEKWEESLLATPFGDGSSVGDHNITIYRDGGVAFLELVKSNGVNEERTVITKINLSTHTARIGFNSGNVIVQTVAAGHSHNSTLHYVGHSSHADFKITSSSPLAGGSAAVVGAEDPRLGVARREGTQTVYKLTSATSSIRVSQNNATSLRVSRWSFATMQEYPSLAYCDSSNQSESGVKYWGKNFSYYCD